MIPSFFPSTYSEARGNFLAACADLGLPLERHVHPLRGREGEELAVDVARFGPPDAGRVLFTMSATHGVEGFCGSGVQTGALRTGLYGGLPNGVAVVLIHAINPYGFSWLRRVTHENVDLNRNHVDHARPYPSNPGYEALKDALCPAAWTGETRAAARAALGAWAGRHGAAALRRAVSGGQYSHPEGLFFGGNAPTWSARTLAAVVSRHAAAAGHVGFVDYHTGIGAYGQCELISEHAPGDPGHARLAAWLDPRRVTSPRDGSSASAPHTGGNGLCMVAAAPHAALTAVTADFGTAPEEQVLEALCADCWLHNHGDPGSAEGRAIKAEIRRCFHPDSEDWKAMVRTRAADIERRMIAGLAALD